MTILNTKRKKFTWRDKLGGAKAKSYLVKFEGYPGAECTWESEENVIDTAAMERYKKNPKTVQRRPKKKRGN